MAQDRQPDPPPSSGASPSIASSASSATELPTSPSGDTVTTSPKSSGFVKRAMDKTADKLHRGKSLLSQSQPALPQAGHRRMLSLTKAKGKERQLEEDQPTAQSQLVSSPPSSPPLSPRKQHRPSGVPGDDESPFITPTSPSLGPHRPENLIFRGFRSMHAGTQTFIQALQAVPWAEDQDNDDEFVNHDVTPPEAESDEDERPVNRLTSSIHAIYRPLARFRKGDPSASSHRAAKAPSLPSLSDNEEPPRRDDSPLSDEDTEGDFEPPEGGSITGPGHSGRMSPETIPDLDVSESDLPVPTRLRERATSRSGSMATVRQNRRGQLAEKLRGVFELENINEVVAEMPCWLLRSVLLQGYMYLTDTYVCFFAHLPSREDQVLKSGSMFKKAQRTKRWIRHWFILKNDVLSWYQSSSDPYFPHGVVDLRYATSCEPLNQKEIRLRTPQKSIRLSCDSVPSRDEWVKAIRKVMLKAQNMGDSIKIAIPYAAIVDVDRSNAMDFSETIEIKVQDKSMDLALDSYFFAYFQDLSTALEQIRDAVRTYRGLPSSPYSPTVVDTTNRSNTRTSTNTPQTETPSRPPAGFRLSSLLKPLQETIPLGRASSAPGSSDSNNEEFTHIVKRGGQSVVPIMPSSEPSSYTEGKPSGRPDSLHTSTSSLTPAPTPTASYHTYPPSFASFASDAGAPLPARESTSSSGWSVGMPSMPSWLRVPSRSFFTSPTSSTRPGLPHAATLPASQLPAVTEVVSSSSRSTSSRPSPSVSGEFGFFSILETPETTVDPDTVEKFREAFAFDDKENLLGIFPGYLFRLLPVYGRLYVSNNYFCFKSSGALTSRTKMILPLRDVLATEKQKSFRFGHHGLVVIVKGHEELFFEFTDEARRDAFVNSIQRQLEDVRHRGASGSGDARGGSGDSRHHALILEELGPRDALGMSGSQASSTDSAPAYMFTSQSSTFLSFKPEKPMHFTFLTIGSRGDVQPYIALAKGLMADGHRVRIATHGEFREWVEAHGIEFGYVGGDPAELMRICVENGTFTVAFLKEGVQKFRGWIDDLLKTSWEACQGTDVLVESPSAMGGYHIAEALKIPYFRAFTMTWSRTRAYPHAFAVPEHKMGGNYNYMTYVLFDQVFWRGTAGQINRWRRNTLGLPSTSLDKMDPHKIPFLYNFSPTIVPPPLDWPEWIRVTGYWFLDDADVSSKKWEPPKDLVDFMDEARKAHKKIVYIGFGSIVVPDPKAMTRCVIDAIVQSGVYAILSKGWSDRLVKNAPAQTEPEEPLPKQIYPISSIPHDWLFKQIDAACHHGGAGTTGASLRAGIPTIIKPFFGDQFFWADRVEALGIGAAVRKLTVASLSHALHEATTNQKLIDRAKLVGEQIRAENGVATAIEAIYRDMEYARSLIKGAAAHHIQHDDYFDAEHATIRDYPAGSSPPEHEHPSPSWTASGPASDCEWSVISDSDEPDPSQVSHSSSS